jgi:hypothetical protein
VHVEVENGLPCYTGSILRKNNIEATSFFLKISALARNTG